MWQILLLIPVLSYIYNLCMIFCIFYILKHLFNIYFFNLLSVFCQYFFSFDMFLNLQKEKHLSKVWKLVLNNDKNTPKSLSVSDMCIYFNSSDKHSSFTSNTVYWLGAFSTSCIKKHDHILYIILGVVQILPKRGELNFLYNEMIRVTLLYMSFMTSIVYCVFMLKEASARILSFKWLGINMFGFCFSVCFFFVSVLIHTAHGMQILFFLEEVPAYNLISC